MQGTRGETYHQWRIRKNPKEICLENIEAWTQWGPFADDNLKYIFSIEKFAYSQISLRFVPMDLIRDKAALVHVMAWRRTGDKSLPEPTTSRCVNTVDCAWSIKLCITNDCWKKEGHDDANFVVTSETKLASSRPFFLQRSCVIITITYGATNDDKPGTMTVFGFQLYKQQMKTQKSDKPSLFFDRKYLLNSANNSYLFMVMLLGMMFYLLRVMLARGMQLKCDDAMI